MDSDVVVKSSTVGKGARDLLFAGLFPGILLGLFAAWGGTASLGWVILIGAEHGISVRKSRNSLVNGKLNRVYIGTVGIGNRVINSVCTNGTSI